MSLFSIGLLSFTIWCIFSVKQEEEAIGQISRPIPIKSTSSLPLSHFNHNRRGSSRTIDRRLEDQSIRHHGNHGRNLHYKSIESIQSSAKSGYDIYRERQEFEKRLLIEPRYIQDQTGVFYDQGKLLLCDI